MFVYEQPLWKSGKRYVMGIDEVGRGAFAGPVVAAGVIFPFDSGICVPRDIVIKDSKKCTQKQRESASQWIQSSCLFWTTAAVSNAEIDEIGIVAATHKAFRTVIKNAYSRIGGAVDHVLIDGFAAEEKLPDLNTDDIEAVKKIVAGSARSMGVKVEGPSASQA